MKFDKPIALAADHGGYELKEAIKAHLDELGIAYTDFGTDSTASVDYPDYAVKAAGPCRTAAVRWRSSAAAPAWASRCVPIR